MDNFALLGPVAANLHQEFQRLFYLLLPLFFAIAIIIDWFKGPGAGADFVDTLKRAFVATLLLVGFQEITGAILLIANGLSDKISDMSGLNQIFQMAGDKAKSYPLSTTSLLLGANDLIIAILSFASYFVLYILRYLMVAVYHFSWIFLTILAPFLLLFHLFTSKITMNLFQGLIEIASWQIVWSVLSAMLTALPFGNAMVADGNYLTVIIINFVIALCMLGTPLVVHALVGSGFSAIASKLGPLTLAAMVAAPAKTATALKVGREVVSNTAGYGLHAHAKVGEKVFKALTSPNANPSSKTPPKNNSTPLPPSTSQTDQPPKPAK
jgi:hypothetical protein